MLNYTQSRQLELLEKLGFAAPSLQDLGTVMAWLLVAVGVTGAGWTLWGRSQSDPWLRLLGKARIRLRKAGLEVTDAEPPRQIALRVSAQFGLAGLPLHDWLLRLEAQRYAPRNAGAPDTGLPGLRAEFRRLHWPR